MALTLVNSYKVEINADSTTSMVSASFTPATGELLVVKAANADADQTFAASPSVSGFTVGSWTQRVNVGTAFASCRTTIWTAEVTSGGTSGTVTVAIGNTATQYHSMVVERWSGWQLDATPATVGVAADSTSPWQQAITTEANGSQISYVCADWTPSDPATRSYSGDTATPSEEQTVTYTSTRYTVYWLTQAAATAGSNTIGLSAPSGMNLTTAAIEIQAAASGDATATAPVIAAAASVPAPAGVTAQQNATAGAPVIAAVASLPAPSVSTGGAQESGPNTPGAAADIGGGTGGWVDQTTFATWTVV